MFHAIHQRVRRIVKEQVCLIKEEHELGLGLVADLGQRLPQLGQHPQQKRCIKPRLLHQLVGSENVDHPAAVRPGANKIPNIERRLAEEVIGALFLQHQQTALYRTDRAGRNITVLCGKLLRAFCHVIDDGPQVGEVHQRQLVVGGNAKSDVEHTLLYVVEFQHA